MANNEYTITINEGTLKPYGLFKNGVNHGYFATKDEVNAAYLQLRGKQ